MYNIIYKINEAVMDKQFVNGLSSFTQSNCQVTLTDDGYRIYRPPNKTYSGDGRTMWGGLVIKPFTNDANAMTKGHSYVIRLDIKGQSSNIPDTYWSNNCGWEGGSYGLSTNPTNVKRTELPTNWVSNEYVPYQYMFTISDDIMKTCTKSYSSFVEGQQYNTYRDFKFGFTYTDTGTLGSDIYIRNLRLYDVTTPANLIDITNNGIVHAGNFVEAGGGASIKSDGEFYATNFIEI